MSLMTPELAQLKGTIDDALHHYLPTNSDIGQTLVDAMRYSGLSGGKRIRPLLVCATCTGLGGALEDALAPACAVEFIHAYSLLHDDLPAMDDDDLRHGLPSGHIKFGEATAILAGDALQALAFETLATAPGARTNVRLTAVQVLAGASGWQGMVGGQSFDLASENKKLSLTQLQSLHAAKTGALIKASVQIGALFGIHTGVFRGGCLTGPGHSGAQLHGFLAYLMKCTATGEPYTVFGYKGKQVRDNIHAGDLVSAFEHYWRNPRVGEAYNIGGGRHANCSMLEAIELCERVAGRSLSWTYSEDNRVGDHILWVSDIRKFESHFPEWRLEHDIESILREMHQEGVERWAAGS